MRGRVIESAEFTQKFTNEFGCVCNEILFTSVNSNRLLLTLFDVKALNADDLDRGYYESAEEALSGLPGGFPMINSIMYTNEAAEKCGIEPD